MVVLFLILLIAFLVRIINLNYNTPFLDEAIYIMLGKKFFAGNFSEVAESISRVGGFPFFYPFISSIFFWAGGILGTRFLNVILGTTSVFLFYLFVKNLHLFEKEQSNQVTALVASALLATSTIPIAFSRLAIYDALAETIFLAGLIFLAKAVFEGDRRWYIFSSVIFFFSFLAKYVVAIFFPFLLLLILWLAARSKNKKKIEGILRDFWLPLIVLILFYSFINFSSLKENFLSQGVGTRAGLGEIFDNFWRYSSFAYLLVLPSSIFLWRKKRGLVVLLLVFASFLPLIFHLLAGNSLSVHQHSFFSLVFILPIIGAFFALITQKYMRVGILIVIAIVFFNLFYSLPKVKSLESFWPNTKNASELLKNEVSPQDTILAEADDVLTLALYNKVSPENITGPFFFSFQNQEGLPAYINALSIGYFDFVELDNTSFNQEQISEIEKTLSFKYSLIFNDGTIRIWRLRP